MSCNKTLESVSKALIVMAMAVLSLAPGAWAQAKFKTLYKFKGGKGGEFPTGIVFDRAGDLYGTTGSGGSVLCTGGCGLVFKLTPNADGSWTQSTLYSFCSIRRDRICLDGNTPSAALIFDQAGNLYGTTILGGALHCGCGVVFELTPNSNGTWKETVLYGFKGHNDGGLPEAGLTFDQTGNLYGTTLGSRQPGDVFELIPNADGTWAEKTLHDFTRGNDGGEPQADVILDQTGNLYGTTLEGGDSNGCQGFPGCGVVFKLTPNADGTWKEKVLHAFTGGDGAFPSAALVFDQLGDLYGTASEGGNLNQCVGMGCGTVFQLMPNPDGSWKEKVLHRFTGGLDGGNPFAGLIEDQAGNLYGTTVWGGDLGYCIVSGEPGGCGVAFKLAPNSNGPWSETVLHRFVDNQGGHPAAGLIFDGAGNLYGTTEGDGITTFGSVFEITP
jgi:uncharacterized repeat protein (TIGR03803 family)